MRATLSSVVAAVAALLSTASCSGASGRFHGEGGPVPDWTLRPNACDSNPYASAGAIDLYYRGADARDTEVVVKADVVQQQVLVRIPGRKQMVVLRASDCSVFDVGVHGAGYEINDTEPRSGHVRIDCARPEIGRVTGEATFTCI